MADSLANCTGIAHAKASPMKAKILILFLALVGILPPAAQAQINYAVSGNTAYVTNSFPPSDNVVIASVYDGYPVTSIGNFAFSSYPTLRSITIPNSVLNIGEFAFYGCGLTNVFIPNSVTNIGQQAFYGCISMTNVILGTNVLSIGPDGFALCILTSVTIPASVTNLASGAFASCNLTNITFLGNAPGPEDNDAFYGNPAKVVYYYYGTSGWIWYFGGLSTAELDTPPLTFVINNNTITITGYTGTNGTVTIDSIINGYPITSIRPQAFYDYTNLTNVVIGNGVTNIGEEAFYDCVNLKNVTISNSVTSIGESAFYHCTNLTSVTIPDSVTSISDSTFSHCTSLTNVTIANGVENIGDYAFWDCYDLTNIVIPATVTNIGDYAFWNCSLSNVFFLGNAPDLGGSVFSGNYFAVVHYYYGTSGWGPTYGGLTAVESGVPFTYTSNYDAITITGYIGTNSAVTIASLINGRPVASIGDGAFANCGLTNITFLGNAPTLGTNVFSGDLATIYYYYGTSGWGTTYGGLPTVMLGAPTPQVGGGNVAMQSGNFGFIITGVTNQTVVVEASTNLVDWQPVWTNTLSGTNALFTDPQWTNYSSRFYRAQ
jgi:BspA type Leucine rich repeat region (6 copies)